MANICWLTVKFTRAIEQQKIYCFINLASKIQQQFFSLFFTLCSGIITDSVLHKID